MCTAVRFFVTKRLRIGYRNQKKFPPAAGNPDALSQDFSQIRDLILKPLAQGQGGCLRGLKRPTIFSNGPNGNAQKCSMPRQWRGALRTG